MRLETWMTEFVIVLRSVLFRVVEHLLDDPLAGLPRGRRGAGHPSSRPTSSVLSASNFAMVSRVVLQVVWRTG